LFAQQYKRLDLLSKSPLPAAASEISLEILGITL